MAAAALFESFASFKSRKPTLHQLYGELVCQFVRSDMLHQEEHGGISRFWTRGTKFDNDDYGFVDVSRTQDEAVGAKQPLQGFGSDCSAKRLVVAPIETETLHNRCARLYKEIR